MLFGFCNLLKRKIYIDKVEFLDYTENFELDDNSSLAKWSSLDLLAEEEDAVSPTGPTSPKQGNQCI